MRHCGPIAPQLTGPTVMPSSFVDELQQVVAPRATPERDRRYRTALSFISLGWMLDGTVAFMNYFIALDALFNEGKGKTERAIVAGATSRILDPTWDTERRTKQLTLMRHEVLHGVASEVSATRPYLRYLQTFGSNPLRDLFVAARECAKTEPGLVPKTSSGSSTGG